MILKAAGIRKSFRSPQKVDVLSGIDFSIGPGESAAITGRSGEGKTTLLHILGTLEAPDSGTIEICGELCTPANAAELRRSRIGFIFQSFNLLEDFTALENVLFPARIARRSPTRAEGLALLASVGLEHRADFPAKLLSGGERQRVAIARALCNNPDLILADEPSGNPDHATSSQVSELLFHLIRTQKKALILVTHDADLARLCSRKYFLSSGLLAQ